MTIGIICAIEAEIQAVKEYVNVISAKNIAGLDFYMGTMSGQNVVLVRSGMGKVNAAVCTQILIDMYPVDMIINVGIAGAIAPDLKIGDIVISDDLVQHDVDATAIGDEPGALFGSETTYLKADDQLDKFTYMAAEELGYSISIGRIASGDQFISSPEAKERIWKTFKAKCCEMEGAAIAQTCFLNKIPFTVIRAISDNADEGTEINYERFMRESALKAACLVKKILELISDQ
ncbi:MAG: 5'-methylthioadenosine/adenosylhomocysteine nucleosidase [Firmicutes bacterium]|nr:5'-methylthioadenosine/adenosylhomocysteine nucleosidase [Bacillota bacterium]